MLRICDFQQYCRVTLILVRQLGAPAREIFSHQHGASGRCKTLIHGCEAAVEHERMANVGDELSRHKWVGLSGDKGVAPFRREIYLHRVGWNAPPFFSTQLDTFGLAHAFQFTGFGSTCNHGQSDKPSSSSKYEPGSSLREESGEELDCAFIADRVCLSAAVPAVGVICAMAGDCIVRLSPDKCASSIILTLVARLRAGSASSNATSCG